MQLHEGQQVVFKHHLVANAIHGRVGRQKVEAPLPSLPLKHPQTITPGEYFMVGTVNRCL
jgi:hypothetical protein